MALKLYNIDGCVYCAMVRSELKRLGLEYETVDVPWPHNQRKEVYEVSGQTAVPVLVDGEVILDDEYDIIDHLKKNYSPESSS